MKRRLKYSTMGDLVFEQVRESILSGEFAPGSQLNQNRLAQRFGVSIIPLREALKRLQAEGYLSIVPHRGIRVKELSAEELEDLYMIRIELESLAAKLALPRLAADDLKRLRQFMKQIRNATAKGDFDTLVDLNREFHFALYTPCRREYLIDLLSMLWERSSRYRLLATFSPERADEALREREDILKAVQEKDENALERSIRYYLEQALLFIQDKTREAQANPSAAATA